MWEKRCGASFGFIYEVCYKTRFHQYVLDYYWLDTNPMCRLGLTSPAVVQLSCRLQAVFAGRGLQDCTSISAVSLIVHAVVVIYVYFMYSNTTLIGKKCLVKQSWVKVG